MPGCFTYLRRVFSVVLTVSTFLPLGLGQRTGGTPLFETELSLRIPDLVFSPSLESGAGDGFFGLVESLINDVLKISSLVPRLAQHIPFPHYQVLLFVVQIQYLQNTVISIKL